MVAKLLTAIITVVIGIGAALALYWLLNKLAELLPDHIEARIKPYFYILPAYLAISVFLLYPAVLTIINSFRDAASTSFVGLQNYSDLFSTPAFRDTLFTTLLWMLVVPAVTVALGLAVAVLADRLPAKWENLSKTIIFMPMAISMVGASIVWRLIYMAPQPGAPRVGMLNAMGGLVGLDPVAWLAENSFKLNSFLLMIILLWAQVGFSMVLLSAAVKGVPEDTLEAARIDGASERQAFFRVVVPQIKGTIITVFVTVLISVMKIFDIVFATTNGQFGTNVIGNEFYNQITTYANYGRASAIVVLLMIATIPVMWYQVRNFKREEAGL
ncbi:MAG: sugar ABC transporter permease [Nocardioides sp.]|jgi:alpha-glucoside transport system permease protein